MNIGIYLYGRASEPKKKKNGASYKQFPPSVPHEKKKRFACHRDDHKRERGHYKDKKKKNKNLNSSLKHLTLSKLPKEKREKGV